MLTMVTGPAARPINLPQTLVIVTTPAVPVEAPVVARTSSLKRAAARAVNCREAADLPVDVLEVGRR